MLGFDNPIHILFILVLLLLVFGAKRLPEMGRSLGTGLRGFKETISGEHDPAHVPAITSATPITAVQPVVTPVVTPVTGTPEQLVAAAPAEAVVTSDPVVVGERVPARRV